MASLSIYPLFDIERNLWCPFDKWPNSFLFIPILATSSEGTLRTMAIANRYKSAIVKTSGCIGKLHQQSHTHTHTERVKKNWRKLANTFMHAANNSHNITQHEIVRSL